jgi:RNA polymerase sigma-70 factor (ECF subfamily)
MTTASEWVLPIADEKVVDLDGDPAEVAATRESVRLAFVAALQHLPPRQRAVLLLREVLAWPAAEVAELLDTTVASVNSALQRARATLAERPTTPLDPVDDPGQRVLLERYVDAFERYDIDALVTLLHADVVLSMPPFAIWLRGADDLAAWFLGQGIGCKGSRLLPVAVNGTAGFASYKPGPSGRLEPWAIQVIDVADGVITGHHNFIFPELFAELGLPPHLEPTD